MLWEVWDAQSMPVFVLPEPTGHAACHCHAVSTHIEGVAKKRAKRWCFRFVTAQQRMPGARQQRVGNGACGFRLPCRFSRRFRFAFCFSAVHEHAMPSKPFQPFSVAFMRAQVLFTRS